MDDYNDSEVSSLECNENCENEVETFITCEKTVHQKAKVTLPISIEPFVVPGKIKAKCCGNPKVSMECHDNCSFLVSQEICIEIPLKFGVSTEVKDEYVECEVPSIDDHCND